jgi:Mg/Co/Ni transporter MgtE
MMNTEYVSLQERATVADAFTALRGNEEMLEGLNMLFLIDTEGRLTGAVPIARLFVASSDTPLRSLSADNLILASVTTKEDKVTELFDKYNLLSLPIIDESGRLQGVITADDVISVLRNR